MLKQIHISNIILINEASISFGEGLNILTGETGAGKSSIMSALMLALGERAEIAMIRKDAQKAFIEAHFDLEPHLIPFLENAGIEIHSDQSVIIRREISASGKNRSFINDQVASLSLIENFAKLLIDIVGQHSHQRLLTLSFQRETLDAFGKHEALVRDVKNLWEKEEKINKELKTLLSQTSARQRELDTCNNELNELNSFNFRDEEEQILFQEYSCLSHAEELTTKTSTFIHELSEGKLAIIPQLQRLKNHLNAIADIDSSLEESCQSFQNALLEIEEVSYTLNRYQEKIESNPLRLNEINERLTLINKMKRKYGQTFEEIKAYKQQVEERLHYLQHCEEQIPELQAQLQSIQQESSALAKTLSSKRKNAAEELEKELTIQIQSLNMPKATLQIHLSEYPRGPFGCDRIEFYIAPNAGEQILPLKECASGGELSRVLLAIKIALAGKDQIPTLIFDEIDANLGGETATIVGDKLQHLGKKYQVICITHLPQVATLATHHFKIQKEEKDGRTIASIHYLDQTTRSLEITRMLGGTTLASKFLLKQ